LRNGPSGRWSLLRRDLIQSVFPHQVANGFWAGFAYASDYRLQCDASKAIGFLEQAERSLNSGLLASEAEMAFPRAGQHNRTVYSVRLYNGKRRLF